MVTLKQCILVSPESSKSSEGFRESLLKGYLPISVIISVIDKGAALLVKMGITGEEVEMGDGEYPYVAKAIVANLSRLLR